MLDSVSSAGSCRHDMTFGPRPNLFAISSAFCSRFNGRQTPQGLVTSVVDQTSPRGNNPCLTHATPRAAQQAEDNLIGCKSVVPRVLAGDSPFLRYIDFGRASLPVLSLSRAVGPLPTILASNILALRNVFRTIANFRLNPSVASCIVGPFSFVCLWRTMPKDQEHTSNLSVSC
ncbi:hypothetical protein LZ30DRAFT_713753 [Colletotrichum cereale]|nr:hypothetical protein LZ30DRAFT_713753 [Colletotrichum cereale]